MTMQDRRLADDVARLADTLRQDLDSLPRNAPLPDLLRRFLGFLQGAFPHSSVGLAYQLRPGDRWVGVGEDPSSHWDDHIKGTEGDKQAGLEFDVNDTVLHGAQCLGNSGARVAVRIERTPPAGFDDIDLVALRLYCSLLDAVSRTLLTRQTEKGLVFSLNQRVLQLTSLIDTGIEVTRLDAGMSPHQLALERAASMTNASRGILIVENQDKTREVYCFPHAHDAVPEARTGNHIASSFSFHQHTYTFQLFEKESRGAEQGFEDTDQMILDALVRQVHASLENRFLHAQALEKQRIEQDIAVAASIQQRLLPASLPAIEGYDAAGINIPSKSVGGDYYDCIPLPDGRIALVIADVSGKGVPAALLVSSLHAYLSAYLESPLTPVDLARRLNRVIWNAAPEDKFITAFLGILSPATGELISVNAGHTPVYLLRESGTVEELGKGGLPFGMLELDLPYTAETTVIQPGDRLLLYTDGVTEAMNEMGELYDSVRPFKEFFARHRPATADRFIQDLIGDVKAFMGSALQNDDITAMYLVRKDR